MRAAEIAAQNLKAIYPNPNLVRAAPTTSIGEVRLTRAPSIFFELAYHDNPEDAAWITENIDAIARNIALSLTEYFGLPFLQPGEERTGTVTVRSGYLNIRDYPSTNSAVLARAYNGAELTVISQWENWYVVQFGNIVGWANAAYVQVSE